MSTEGSGDFFLQKLKDRAYILDKYTGKLAGPIVLAQAIKGDGMGTWLVRTEAGKFDYSPASDNEVVHLFNSGMKTCIIGPTTSSGDRTEAKGTRGSSTDRKPAPSPDM